MKDQKGSGADEMQLEPIRSGAPPSSPSLADAISVRDHTLEWTKLLLRSAVSRCLGKALAALLFVYKPPQEAKKEGKSMKEREREQEVVVVVGGGHR